MNNLPYVDLRSLSWLHVLRYKEGFAQEAGRLKESQPIDDLSWQSICDMGRDLCLEDVLFKTHDDGSDHTFKRREQDIRITIIP